jgi:uncharacterized protein (DUF305 family)
MGSPTRQSWIHRGRCAAVAAALTVSVLAGCGDQTGESAPVDATHNEADVVFAQGMIPHHAQALEMVEMAQERDLPPEIEELAAQIEDAQEPEIETLSGWLEAWDQQVPDVAGKSAEEMAEMEVAGEAGAEDATRMMSAMSMRQLRNAPDTAFKDVWLSLMIAHHEGAVRMAETQVAEGENADAVSLAEEIMNTQGAEIAVMESLVGR